MQCNPSPPPAPITHAMSCIYIRAFQAPAIDVEHPMTILQNPRSFLGWIFMDFHQWVPNRHGIYGLPPTAPRTPTHFMDSIPTVVHIQSYQVLHLRENLALLAKPDPYFQCKSCDLVELRPNFSEHTYQPTKDGV